MDINEPRRPASAAAPPAAQRPPTRPTRAVRANADVVPVVTSSGRLVRLSVRYGIDFTGLHTGLVVILA